MKHTQIENYVDNPKELPGYLKKSFSLYYHGGEIWVEHLDGLYGYEKLVLEKLNGDLKNLLRPSTSGYICINLDETIITDNIINRITEIFTLTDKRFVKICFVGVDRKTACKIKKNCLNFGIMIAFENDFEKAKEWLL